MPLRLTLAQEDTGVVPPGTPAWRIIHRRADAAASDLAQLWQSVLADASSSPETTALESALDSGNALGVEGLLIAAWETRVAAVAQPLLPPLLQQTAMEVATALTASLAMTLMVDVASLGRDLVHAVDQALAGYAGNQIVDISETTRIGVRQILRSGLMTRLPLDAQAQELANLVGITPRQVASLERLQALLEEEGLADAQVAAQVAAAAQRAKLLRGEAIARTESIDAAVRGQQALWEHAEEQGFLHDGWRRYWLVTPDDRLCPICAAIPSLNPEGVGLRESFQTPVGPKASPTAHPQCRCSVTLREPR